MTTNKIKKISEIADIIDPIKSQGKKIIHCHGVFDLVHPDFFQYTEHLVFPIELASSAVTDGRRTQN